MSSFPERMIRAAKLDTAVYEEVEADTGATVQALLVVVIANVATALGTWGLSTGGNVFQPFLGALVSWVGFAVAVYLVGAKLLREPQTEADVWQLLRTIGFASSPGVINVLGLIPFLAVVTIPVAAIWTLVATVVAVRQALDYTSTLRAVIVCVIGAIAFALVRLLIWFITLGGV